jgi:acetate kinase
MRRPSAQTTLTLNVGSSSLKFALFARSANARQTFERVLSGQISRIGLSRAIFRASGPTGVLDAPHRSNYRDASDALDAVFDWLDTRPGASRIDLIGHRVVHGGLRYREPVRVVRKVLVALRRLIPLDPDHLPGEIRSIELALKRQPDSVHVACFDTAFHQHMLPSARIYGLPRALARSGVIRYGFHGLSFESIVRKFGESSRGRGRKRLIVAHLGSGSSLCAIRNGRGLDTTMGFSPTGGLVMGRRSGDLDPSVVLFLADHLGYSTAQLRKLLNEESGLLGVSGRSSDMEDLLKVAETGNAAQIAIDLFCYQVQQHAAALTIPLGGLDALIFTGGIGENAPAVRAQICGALRHLGIRIDANRNRRNAGVISSRGSPVQVQVIPTDEEFEIARATFHLNDTIRKSGG